MPVEHVGGQADTLLRLGVLNYTDDRPDHWQQARRLLAENPDLASADIYTIAATGNVDAASLLLARDPLLASTKGGPYEWEPLLYLAYSQIGTGSAVDVARLLIDAGASPDAGYLWRELPSPFTALTGAFGGGEQGQPPHPESLSLARLLLESGADPNDNQALYNRMFEPANDHLSLLFEFGLGTDTNGPWRRKLGTAIPSPTAMVTEQLRWAAAHNFVDRVRLLLDHGVDPNGLGYHPGYGSRTSHELATMAGNREIAQLLVASGAKISPLDDVDTLLAACMAGDGIAVRASTAADPLLPARAIERMPDAPVNATRTGRLDAVRLVLELGFGVDATAASSRSETALHAAAELGHLAIAKFLVEAGADRDARDRSYDGTPLGWAEHCDQPEIVAYLTALGPEQIAKGT